MPWRDAGQHRVEGGAERPDVGALGRLGLFDARRLKVTMTREGKTISADDYRLTLPIPQAEIDANSGISESDQNYGY